MNYLTISQLPKLCCYGSLFSPPCPNHFKFEVENTNDNNDPLFTFTSGLGEGVKLYPCFGIPVFEDKWKGSGHKQKGGKVQLVSIEKDKLARGVMTSLETVL